MRTNQFLLRRIAMISLSCLLSTACTQSRQPPVAIAPVSATSRQTSSAALQLANAQDAICHMPVTPADADTLLYQGKVYGFCSASCKRVFRQRMNKNQQYER